MDGVVHASSPPFVYQRDSSTLHIRLKTRKNNTKKIHLVHGDMFDNDSDGKWISNSTPMYCSGSDELFEYWVSAIQPEHKRSIYFFEIHSTNGSVDYYGEQGYNTCLKEASKSGFNYPYLHDEYVFKPPEWVKDTIWYQIFPERFANGNAELNPLGTEEWGNKPTRENFFGGDFQGIINNINYLVELGITGIYMTPIFKATSNHKYDTVDYYEIDPQFGTKEKLRELIDILHSHNIKIMFDCVFNHTGENFPQFQNVIQEGENSKYKNWFNVKQFPIVTSPKPNYECFGFFGQMPKLNLKNKETRDYILGVVEYWTREFKIDAWRLDVANEIVHSFWRDFRALVKSINPNIFILGECWYNTSNWLQGDQFDSTMNYPLQKSVLNFFCKRNIPVSKFCDHLTRIKYWYSDNINSVLFNLLGSHDTSRILTRCKQNFDLLKMILTFHYLYVGTPCLYYGDEIGIEGGNDPECRKCMVWEKDKQNTELLNYTKNLIKIRKDLNNLGFFGGGVNVLGFIEANNFLCYEILKNEIPDPDDRLVVFINNGDEKVNYDKIYDSFEFIHHFGNDAESTVVLIDQLTTTKNVIGLSHFVVMPFEAKILRLTKQNLGTEK
jgi:cyclomaltodextrinase